MGKAKESTKIANQKKALIKDPALRLPKIRPIYFRPSYIVLGVIAFILAIFFARVAIWEHIYLDRMEGSARHTVSTDANITPIAEVEDDSDESVPTKQEIVEYTVAPGKPRYFSIPSIGINNARVVEIGLKTSGELSTPYNIYDVGWYTASALPGTNKVTVMDGHSGNNSIGVFGKLPRIAVGGSIIIEMGDGRKYTYTVVETATKKLGEEANQYMTTAFESPVPGQGSLTLITCTGDYLLTQKTFSHRLFVRAVLEN